MLQEKRKKLSLFTIFLTFFADNLGWSIVFPIFAPFFVDVDNKLFAVDISLATRTVYLGVFLAAFPFAQFFGAPLLGDVADKMGRKKALSISVLLTALGYLISSWSIHSSNLSVLFISRLFTGLFAGNLSICLAAVVDISDSERQKIKYFGYFSIIAGFSFIVGTFIGGKFADSSLNKLFNPAFPLLISSIIAFLNFILIVFCFYDKEQKKKTSFDFLEGLHNIQQALKTKKIKSLYLMYFFFAFSWTLVLQFTPLLMIKKFQFSFSEIGDISAYMGICWALGSVFAHAIVKRFSKLKVLETCLWIFTVICLLIILPIHLMVLLTILGFGVVFAGIAWPLCTELISSNASSQIQGKILGMSQSVLSLAMFLSPILAGLLDSIYWGIPFILAAFFNLLAALVYFSIKNR